LGENVVVLPFAAWVLLARQIVFSAVPRPSDRTMPLSVVMVLSISA